MSTVGSENKQLLAIFVLTAAIGCGYLYELTKRGLSSDDESETSVSYP